METSAALRPIVIVDDSEDDIFLLERTLRKTEFTNPVLTFLGPQRAVRYLQGICEDPEALVPFILFLDVNMFCWHGTVIAEWVHSSPLAGRFPVVMVTSSDDPMDLELARRAGADSYWLKPAPLDGVLDALRAARGDHAGWPGALERRNLLLSGSYPKSHNPAAV